VAFVRLLDVLVGFLLVLISFDILPITHLQSDLKLNLKAAVGADSVTADVMAVVLYSCVCKLSS
jgi:hypothetical protein